MQLFQQISENIEAPKIEECRTNFLRGFIGQKILEPVSKCPIESMFWDWIFSYYPDNEGSAVRFASMNRSFLTFVLDHRRFAAEYADWIKKNEATLIQYVTTAMKPKISVVDIKLYANMTNSIIQEKLTCVFL